MWPLGNFGLVNFLDQPAWGHQVELATDVGATLHIEPNDIPQAGAPTEAWFALTAAGGAIIPLENCDCILTVYDQVGATVATPPLSPTTAEGYENIPGTTLTFPTVGAYELVLMGQPNPETTADFQPFELRFDVTVAGTAAPQSPQPTPTATTATAPDIQEPPAPISTSPTVEPWLIGGGILVAIVAALVLWRWSKGTS